MKSSDDLHENRHLISNHNSLAPFNASDSINTPRTSIDQKTSGSSHSKRHRHEGLKSSLKHINSRSPIRLQGSVSRNSSDIRSLGSESEAAKLTITSSRKSSRHSTDEDSSVMPNSPHKNEGIISSIVNAAHSAANMISNSIEREPSSTERSSSVDEKGSFSRKLDLLLKPKKTNKHSSQSTISNGSSGTDEQKNDMNNSQIAKEAPTSNVHFASIRESPVNSFGNGDLSLDDFSNHRNSRIHISPNISSENLSTQEYRTSQSPNASSFRRQLSSNGSTTNNRPRSSSRVSMGLFPRKSSEGPLSTLNDNLSQSTSILDSGDVPLKYANSKDSKEFHEFFKQIPSSEKLVETFSCALSKDILVQGKMYLSEGHICFNSNILGWVTNLIIPLQEVIQIEKRSTAVLFPNGMVIQTLHHKYVFATFLSRDAAFDLITNVWRRVLFLDENDLTRPSADIRNSQDGSLDNLDEFTTDKDDSLALEMSNPEDGEDTSIQVSSATDLTNSSEEVKKVDDGEALIKQYPDSTSSSDELKVWKGFKYHGPLKHGLVEMDYKQEQNEVFISDDVVNAPLGVICSIIFGPDKSNFVQILKNQKNFDIEEDKIVGLTKLNDERNYSYIKPLSGPIGPKQTKCLITEKLVEYDLNDHVLLEQITVTPDVPSGSSFLIKTKLYLSWAESNSTRIHVITGVEWTGKSWIKGAIEKGSIEGQKESMKELLKSLREIVKGGGANITKKEKKKRRRSSTTAPSILPTVDREKRELSILEQLNKLLDSISEKVGIPYFSSFLKLFMLVSCIYTFILALGVIFHSSASTLDVKRNGDFSQVSINGNEYFMIPFADSYLNDDSKRIENEKSMWKWIKDKSEGKILVKDRGNSDIRLKDVPIGELDDILQEAQVKMDYYRNKLDLYKSL